MSWDIIFTLIEAQVGITLILLGVKGMLDNPLTPFWVIFLKDPSTGIIHGTAYRHNATADYKNNPYYVGTEKIKVDMGKFES